MTTDLDLQKELIDAKTRVAELEQKTKTTLSGTQFLVMTLIGPLFLAFVTLGVLIVWKTTSSPTTVAPHLDIILVAFSIFALPVTSAAGVLTSLLVDEVKSKARGNSNET